MIIIASIIAIAKQSFLGNPFEIIPFHTKPISKSMIAFEDKPHTVVKLENNTGMHPIKALIIINANTHIIEIPVLLQQCSTRGAPGITYK